MKNSILARFKTRAGNIGALKIFTILMVLLFYGSFLVIPISLPHMDNDAGLYITDGKVIMETHKVFRNNIYSYTEPDHPVYDHHWLSSVTFYLVSEIFGFEGLTILKTVVLLSAYLVLFLASNKKADFWLVALFSLPTILVLAGRNRIRPEMFSYLFFALFLYLLFDLEKNPNKKRIFWLVPIQLLWVNFHLFFFLGIVLVAGFLFEKVICHVPKKFWKLNLHGVWADPVVKKLLLVLLMLFAVVFVNPNGTEGAFAPFRTHSYASFTVSENQPFFNLKASILSWGVFDSPFVPMILVFLVSCIFGLLYRSGSVFLLCAGLGSAAAGLVQVRLVTLFAFIFLPAASSQFNGVFLALKNWIRRKWPKRAIILGYSLAVIVALIYPYKIYEMTTEAASQGYKTGWSVGLDEHSNGAGKFFKENGLKGPIFNDYDIGGYILYHLFPEEKVFVDNNGADSYPVSFFDEVFMPAMSSDEAWHEIQKKYGINAIFISLRNGNPDTGGFLWRRLHDTDWVLVYVDTYAVILIRNIYDNRAVIDKFYNPENINQKMKSMLESENVSDRIVAGRFLYLLGRDDLSTSVLKKVVAEYPKNSWVWLYMGSIKVWNNDPQSLISALIFLENAVNMGEKTSEGYTWLGLAYFRSGRFEKAEEALQKALWLDPGRQDTTNYLNQLQEYLAPNPNIE